MRGLSLVAASGDHSSSRCAGLSLSRALLLRSTGSRRTGSVVVAHGPSCSAACGIFPDQGSNPCPPHWQADSQPLRHQGSPPLFFKSFLVALCVCIEIFNSSENTFAFAMQNSHNHIFNGNLVVPMQYIQGAVLSSLILNAPFIIHLTPICTQVYFWVLFYSSDLFVYSTQTTNYCCFLF